MRRPPETGLPGSRAAAPENTANAPFPPEAPQAALWSTRSQATKQSSSASFCWSLFRAKARKRSASGRSIERAHCMRANEKEGWFAVKKLLLTAGIALTVLLLLGIFLWFGPYGTQLL